MRCKSFPQSLQRTVHLLAPFRQRQSPQALAISLHCGVGLPQSPALPAAALRQGKCLSVSLAVCDIVAEFAAHVLQQALARVAAVLLAQAHSQAFVAPCAVLLALQNRCTHHCHMLQATAATMPEGLHEVTVGALGAGSSVAATVMPSLRRSAHQDDALCCADPRATAAGDS